MFRVTVFLLYDFTPAYVDRSYLEWRTVRQQKIHTKSGFDYWGGKNARIAKGERIRGGGME